MMGVSGVSSVLHNKPFSTLLGYANKVTPGGSLERFRVGTGCQKNRPVIRGLELSAPSLTFWEER